MSMLGALLLGVAISGSFTSISYRSTFVVALNVESPAEVKVDTGKHTSDLKRRAAAERGTA
jgi:hypothetical protein